MELAFQTVKENMYMSKKIDYKMVDILTKALQLERNSETNADDLRIIASNVENETLVAAREALMNQFRDTNQNRKQPPEGKTYEDRLYEIDQEDNLDGTVLDPSRRKLVFSL